MNVFKQFFVLTKPRVVQLIVFCALIGMVLAVPGVPTLAHVGRAAVACLGIWLVASAAAAFNCIVEKGIDAKRVVYKGYGKRYPLVPNTSAEGRKTNQRVEIKILKVAD